MMFSIAAHEFRYMFRSFQTMVVFFVFFGVTFLLTANGSEFQSTARGGNVYANSPYMITAVLITMAIFAIMIVPSFMANAVLKDVDNKFDAILFSTPISKRDYLIGRFSGAFAAMMVALAGAPMGMLLGTFWPWADPETLASTHIGHYVTVYLGFIVPSMLAVAAIIFSVAVVSRNILYAYLAALAMLILYLAVGESGVITPLWDPFMYKIFEEHTQYWTAAERNTNLISYEGIVLANRFIWFAVAVAFYTLSFKLFSFRTPTKRAKKSQNRLTVNDPQKARIQLGFRGTPVWTKGTPYRQFLSRTKFEVMSVLKSLPFLILMGFSAFLLMMALLDREVMYEVNAYPITRVMVGALTDSMVWALLGVLIFYSADIIWRERKDKFSEIMDAMPTPNWVFVVSKLLALVVVMYAIMLLGIVIAISLQILNGYHHFEIALYLERGLFYFPIQFIFLAILACFFQVLGRGRLTGMALMGLFMAFNIGSADILGFEHPLLRYALGGIGAPLSDMNGSGRFMKGGYLLRVYWAAFAGLLLMATHVLWNRGPLQPMKVRLRAFRAFKSATFALPALLLFLVLVGTGSHIYYNTNLLNDYANQDDLRELQITYEKKYRQYEDLPMPRTIDIKVDVDIYPYKRRVETRSTQILLNTTDHEIETVHLVFPSGVEVPMVVLEGARQRSLDKNFNYYIFDLDTPLQPGQKLWLKFETLIQRKGFRHRSHDTTLVRNGTFIHNNQIAPYIGFNPDYMISDRNTRRKYGLEPLPRIPALEDSSQYGNNVARQDSDFVTFKTTVSTVASQTAVAPGHLEKEWIEGDRRYFTYKMEAPIRNFYAYLSAEYEVARDAWNGIQIEVFYHSPHNYNVGRMIESVKDSLSYFNQAFGPYQYRQVRILEFPAYRKFAQAFPNTIPYSEGMGFVAQVAEGDIDLPYYVTAHEMAHQWWGYQLTAANTQGASLLHETLAQYSALLVMEEKYGKNQIRKFLKFELDRYLSGRADDPEGELPLYRVEKQKYIHYRKGSLIMYALRDYLGVEVVNRSLQRLLALRAFSSTPYATSTDLLDILKQEAGAANLGLIEDFFEKITLFDVRLEGSRVVELADGRFLVSLDIVAAKFYADAIGNERETTFDIPVDIGLFQRNPADDDFGASDVIMLEKRRLSGAKASIEILVDKKPRFAGIDPYHKLIDRNSNDNLGAVEDQGLKPSGMPPGR